jgi:carbonic anhydrase
MLKTCAALLLCLVAFASFLAAQQPPACSTPCKLCEPSITRVPPLDALLAGNARFIKRGGAEHWHQTVECGINSACCPQKPIAVILSCSDSRVPPEVIFDLGIGDLFVVREAGNVATPGVLGSIEYAVDPHHLGAKLVVIMGHKRCGAVEAAFCPEPKEHLLTLWTLIRPAVPEGWRRKECIPHPVPEITATEWERVVRKNIDNMTEKVKEDLQVLGLLSGVSVVPAYYDLDKGSVELPKK